MADSKIRSFLAIRPDDSSIQEISNFVTKIQPHYPRFRFIPPKNWHLTLHFLGPISSEQIDALNTILPEWVSKINPFPISFKGLGGFSQKEKSRILGTAVNCGLNPLISLKEILGQVLLKMQFSADDRPYHAHLTLARSRNPVPLHIPEAERNVQFSEESRVKNIILYQSKLSSEGSEYTALNHFHLKTSNF